MLYMDKDSFVNFFLMSKVLVNGRCSAWRYKVNSIQNDAVSDIRTVEDNCRSRKTNDILLRYAENLIPANGLDNQR